MKVMLATDGSRHATAAENVLFRFPFGQRPELHIVTVGPSPDLSSVAAIPETVMEMVEQSRSEAEEVLAAAVERCRPHCESVTSEMLDGHPAQEILAAAERWQPDLIVVGARGLGVMSRLLIGSVSERIAKHAHCSVLVARDHHDSPEIHRIMIAYDHSAGAQAAANRMASLPLGAERSVILHTVLVPPPRFGRDRIVLEDEEELRSAAERHLAVATEHLKQATPNVTQHLQHGADSADGLIDRAVEVDADLIVVGSTGKNAIERFLLGSFSMQVLHHAPCSVWIERAKP